MTRKVNGKNHEVITSITDPMDYPVDDIGSLYGHRWEIELGYREQKQHRLTLRSRLPELVNNNCGEY